MFTKQFLYQYKSLLTLALPVCIGQLGIVTVGVVDTLMAGNLGPIPLASATFALSLVTPFLMLCIGFSYGITPLISKAAGAKQVAYCGIILKNGMALNLGFVCLLSALLYFGTDAMVFFNQPTAIFDAGIPFFKVLVLSLIPLQFYQVYKQFAEGLSLTRQAMYISITANILNIILNYFLIFGKGGFPSYGLIGSAYATLLSRVYMAFVIWVYINFHPRFAPYLRVEKFLKFSIAAMSSLSKISIPIGIQLILETGAFSFAAIMAGWLGIYDIGAHQIALSLASITYMAATGISAAATIRVGNESGAGNMMEIKQVGLSAYLLIILFECCCTIVFILFRNILPQFYIDNEQVIALASSLLLITAFFQLSDGIQVVGLGILRGLGDVTIPTGIAVVSYWLIALPLGYFFSFSLNMGVQGIWYGLMVGLSIAALLLYLRFRSKTKDMERNI